MNSSQLFNEMPGDLAQTILYYLRDEQREAYKAAITTLAQHRKLRPVFVQRKPKEAQIQWLAQTLSLKGSAEVGDQVLSIFLMQGRQEMLKHFLDLPETLDSTRLHSSVDNLLRSYPEQEGVLYLKIFQQQSEEGWPELQAIIDTDPRFTSTVEVVD
jgi:hypothetical protein